ncbi:hypothetical protein KKH39_01150 [Patescibacteria group bacterium]|nr:hypothetical protein [Patescibacteria group bacterium]
MEKKLLIGFIGQGWIGKNYADDFQNRGFNIVRYDIDTYAENKDKIKNCDIVLIAVPTPTTPEGFDDSIVDEVLNLIGDGKVAVIKSTVQVGTTKKMQTQHPNIIVMHSPEFLTEKTAAHDAKHPYRNIVGVTDIKNETLKQKGELVLSVLAKAPYNKVMQVENAEMIKYGGNCWFYFKVVFMNMFYDLAEKKGLDFETIKEGMKHDLRIGPTHLDVIHQGGRGAGGHCFIKDFEAFIEMLDSVDLDQQKQVCEAVRDINLKYLTDSGKNPDLVRGVYGK